MSNSVEVSRPARVEVGQRWLSSDSSGVFVVVDMARHGVPGNCGIKWERSGSTGSWHEESIPKDFAFLGYAPGFGPPALETPREPFVDAPWPGGGAAPSTPPDAEPQSEKLRWRAEKISAADSRERPAPNGETCGKFLPADDPAHPHGGCGLAPGHDGRCGSTSVPPATPVGPDEDGQCTLCGLPWPDERETLEPHECQPGFRATPTPPKEAPTLTVYEFADAHFNHCFEDEAHERRVLIDAVVDRDIEWRARIRARDDEWNRNINQNDREWEERLAAAVAGGAASTPPATPEPFQCCDDCTTETACIYARDCNTCELAASEIPNFGTNLDKHRCPKFHRDKPRPVAGGAAPPVPREPQRHIGTPRQARGGGPVNRGATICSACLHRWDDPPNYPPCESTFQQAATPEEPK